MAISYQDRRAIEHWLRLSIRLDSYSYTFQEIADLKADPTGYSALQKADIKLSLVGAPEFAKVCPALKHVEAQEFFAIADEVFAKVAAKREKKSATRYQKAPTWRESVAGDAPMQVDPDLLEAAGQAVEAARVAHLGDPFMAKAAAFLQELEDPTLSPLRGHTNKHTLEMVGINLNAASRRHPGDAQIEAARAAFVSLGIEIPEAGKPR